MSDAAWWRSYWDDVRPRFVLLRVSVGSRFTLRWAVPLWAFEETLRFGLLTLPWVAHAARRLPPSRRAQIARWTGREHPAAASDAPPWSALGALVEGQGEGMLRLAPGEPFVLIEATDGTSGVAIELKQI